MEKLKVYIRHVLLWELKNSKNATKTVQTICRIYGLDVITDSQVQNRFLKFHSGDISMRDEPRLGCSSDLYQDAF